MEKIMLNIMKSKMVLMVIIALIGAYIAYQHMSGKALVSSHSNVGTTIANTGNPLLDYDIGTVKGWFNFDCFAELYGQDYGKGKPDAICISKLIENVKRDTGITITQDQIIDPTVRNTLVARTR